MVTKTGERYRVVDFESLPGTPCPCGIAKRAFMDIEESPNSIHVTQISTEALTHYHKLHTETYYILECGAEAAMELDDAVIPVSPGMSIFIPPGVRHRAIGEMKIINIVHPKFDPEDEYFD